MKLWKALGSFDVSMVCPLPGSWINHVLFTCHLFLLLEALQGFVRLLKVLEVFGMVWKVLEGFGSLCETLQGFGCFGRFREALKVVARYGRHWELFRKL